MGDCYRVADSWSGGTAALANPNNASQGVVVSFDNGDKCDTKNRKWSITFTCDPHQESPGTTVGSWSAMENPPNSCSYHAKFPTEYACLPSPGPDGPTTSSGGWGATFNIIFVVTASCYFVFGAAYQKKFNDASSLKEFIPNYEFWADLPSLCWDGVQFVNEKFASVIGRGYNRI